MSIVKITLGDLHVGDCFVVSSLKGSIQYYILERHTFSKRELGKDYKK